MKVTELKIDNLLLLNDNKIVRVLWFKIKVACIMEVGVEYPSAIVSLDRLKPIPLTEEWLLKFKFKNIDSTYTIDNDRFEFSFIFYDAWNLYYKEKKGFGCDEINLTGFWDIHQLQNLYFALTGEELKILP